MNKTFGSFLPRLASLISFQMMRQLHLNEGECVRITYSTLPKATYTKLKPQSTDFLSISNPRAVLEVELRKFACLTKGDIIAVEVSLKYFFIFIFL